MLEAMQERQTSIAGVIHPLPTPFMVLATQNPIEEEGTYLLPQAQMDRFLLKEVVEYPRDHEEIGRAHVLTPVTNAHLVCLLLLEKKKYTTNKKELLQYK